MKKQGNGNKKPKSAKKRFHGLQKYEIVHSIQRAFERHELQLDFADILIMSKMIKEGKSKHIKRISNTRTIKLIERFQTKTGNVIENIAVIYDNSRSTIATVLPKNARELDSLTENMSS